MSSGGLDVRESLHVLFETRRGERFLRPDYGSSLHREVFEAFDSSECDRIRVLVEEAIRLHERRVDVVGVEVLPDGEDSSLVHVGISYRLLDGKDVERIDLALSQGRVRHA
jgi:phage baseplate assembly protein W